MGWALAAINAGMLTVEATMLKNGFSYDTIKNIEADQQKTL